MDYKHDRFLDELKKHISLFIQLESNKRSMITVTNIALSKDFKKATFFVTVFPETGETAALDFLHRNQKTARGYLKTHSKLSRLPFIEFALDKGEKSRQRLDMLS
jgi:ribosome-binding factor A